MLTLFISIIPKQWKELGDTLHSLSHLVQHIVDNLADNVVQQIGGTDPH